MRKKIAIALAVFILSGGAILYGKRFKTDKGADISNRFDASSSKSDSEAVTGKDESPASDISSSKKPAVQASAQLAVEAIPKGTRSMTKGDQKTACTPAYEDMMESVNNPEVLDSVGSKITENCLAELFNNVKNFEQIMKALTESCVGKKEAYSEDEKQKCMRLASLMRTAFAENEFQGMDPKNLPSPVLRAMIVFRVLQGDEFTKTEKDLDYYQNLVAEEQRLSPDSKLSSLHSMLIGKLYQSNPEKYLNEFYSTVMDIEKRSPEAGLTSRIARYDNKISDPEFQGELDDFVQRYPQEPYGHYIKAALLANKEDWAGADALMARIMSMSLSDGDKVFYESERKKFASKEQGFTQRYSVSVSM